AFSRSATSPCPASHYLVAIVAEGEGFEPPDGLPRLRFSRPSPSTARPTLRSTTRLPTTDAALACPACRTAKASIRSAQDTGQRAEYVGDSRSAAAGAAPASAPTSLSANLFASR